MIYGLQWTSILDSIMVCVAVCMSITRNMDNRLVCVVVHVHEHH